MLLYAAADLLWATRIKSAAEDLSLAARPVRSVEMLEARLADTEPTGLIVDLESEAALDIIRRAVQAQQDGERLAKIVAFGPHADEALLKAAADAGATTVMARGAFSARIADVLTALSEPRQ